MRKKGSADALSLFFKRLFRARNIIVVSAHKVDHIPLSGKLQILLVGGVLMGVSLFSYMAGDYASTRHLIAEKERKLQNSEMQKNMMDKDFALLKRDLAKVRNNGKELTEYSKFILDQYARESKKSVALGGENGQLKLTTSGNDGKLLERVQYLEHRINQIMEENSQLIVAIKERTDGKIDLFEDIIATTGLSRGTLEHAAAALPKKADSANAAHPKAPDYSGEGGPFIPAGPTSSFGKDANALLGNIERLMRLNEIVNILPIGLPIAHYQERSGFGSRTDPFSGEAAFHPGLDMAGPFGAKIVATNDGVVTAAGRDGSYGNMIDIEHGLSLSTRYGHLSQIFVHEGQHVKKGQLIGLEGSTGRSTGPHLHYEVRYHDHPIDPKKFLNARSLYVSQAD